MTERIWPRGQGQVFWPPFGVMPAFGENFYLGFKLNYYAATYTKEVVGDHGLRD